MLKVESKDVYCMLQSLAGDTWSLERCTEARTRSLLLTHLDFESSDQ